MPTEAEIIIQFMNSLDQSRHGDYVMSTHNNVTSGTLDAYPATIELVCDQAEGWVRLRSSQYGQGGHQGSAFSVRTRQGNPSRGRGNQGRGGGRGGGGRGNPQRGNNNNRNNSNVPPPNTPACYHCGQDPPQHFARHCPYREASRAAGQRAREEAEAGRQNSYAAPTSISNPSRNVHVPLTTNHRPLSRSPQDPADDFMAQ